MVGLEQFVRARIQLFGTGQERALAVGSLRRIALKLDPVKVQSSAADGSRNSHWFLATGRKKLKLHLRSQVEVRQREQTHSAFAQLDSASVELR